YECAASKVGDASTRKLLGDLAEAERKHVTLADNLQEEYLTPEVEAQEEKAHRRLFVLQIVQPGLAGLMDGSVSTLAPVFAAAFATHSSHAAFVVGLAASVGAGISMAFAEAASDDGSLTGRGKPLLRGFVCGLMTTAGGIGHTLPYLIPEFRTATAIAVVIVAIELLVISWIRKTVYGYALSPRRISSDCWRSVGLSGWDLDRKLLILLTERPSNPTACRLLRGIDRAFRNPQQCQCRSPRRENQKMRHRVAASQ